MPTKKKPVETVNEGNEVQKQTVVQHNDPPPPANLPAIARSAPAPAIAPASLELDRYHGASSIPVSTEQGDILMAPIKETDVEIRPDGILYYPEIKYRRVLNMAFGPMGWALVPLDPQPVLDDDVMTQQWALYVGGRFAAQCRGQMIYQASNRDMTYADAAEGVKSNALMRCCKDLSIASELWDPNFIEAWKAQYAVQVWRKPKQGQSSRRPEWRRSDRPEFWDETGIVGQAPKKPIVDDPHPGNIAPKPKQKAEVKPENLGQPMTDNNGNRIHDKEYPEFPQTPQHQKLKSIIEDHIKKTKMAPGDFGKILLKLTKGADKDHPEGATTLEQCTLKMVVMAQGTYAKLEEEAKAKKAGK